MRNVLRFGAWNSPISSERVASAGLRLGQPRIDGDGVVWLEGRPTEGGRQVLMRASPTDGNAPHELVAAGFNVRTRVHEYGGGDYSVWGGRVFAVDFADQQIHVVGENRRLGAEDCRYADLEVSPDGRWLVAVEERHAGATEPLNRLAFFDLRGGEGPRRFATGHDFVSFPRFSPDGSELAFTAWEHPNMPWNATRLYRQQWTSGGPQGEPRWVAGGDAESIFQPAWSPDGALTFVSDRTGWWNLYRFESGADSGAAEPRPLCPRSAEFGLPQWVFGMSTYAYLDDGSILCAVGEMHGDRLARLDPSTGELAPLSLPLTAIRGVDAAGGRVCLLGASPTQAEAVFALDPTSGRLTELRTSFSERVESEWLSHPEAIEFDSANGRTAHVFFYPPTHPTCTGPPGEAPPLLVKCHGGPTAATAAALDWKIQYWTSRGIAVADVNYSGSTGYGREYRDRLAGQWGVVDVEDCVAAAQWLAREGRADGERLAISGGSAGGYTVLCALTFHDVFAAGASHYGIGDLEALAQDTHKFESRYTDWLIAPYPQGRELWRARSPIHSCDKLSCPVIFFQGLEDKVVPPGQAEAMVAALAKRGLRHAYVPFEGEQHGFRRAENIAAALEGEREFYAQEFGFHEAAKGADRES